MSDHRVNRTGQANGSADRAEPLSTEEISQLLLASSLAATNPVLGLIKFLIKEGILDGEKFKAFLAPMLVADSYPIATKAMLDPIWKSFLAQIGEPNGTLSSHEAGHG
jgi:hypothetical protein